MAEVSGAARITVIGLSGPGAGALTGLAPAARQALASATLVAGGRRHLEALAAAGIEEGGITGRRVVLEGDLSAALEAIEAHAGPSCVLASGDPGFFGIVRPLAARFGSSRLDVHPAPSSVALAFARLGLPWDDSLVVSAHGRPLEAAARAAAAHPKVAVLVAPGAGADLLGRALLDAGASHTTAAVCSRLGSPQERVELTDLAGLAAGVWDPLCVVVLLADAGVPACRTLAWGLPEEAFAHRDGMVTKAEVRAIVLGKLALPGSGVMWDVGAGSGSVAVECARLAPGLRVVAVEQRPDDASRVAANAARHGVRVQVVTGQAPSALAGLDAPDRVFLGGGGPSVLDAVMGALSPGGRVVATFAALERAAAAADRLGHLVQVGLARGCRLPDGGLRLSAENPVFVVWGPEVGSAKAGCPDGRDPEERSR